MQRIADVLGRWGYRIGRAKDQRLPSALGLALLLNRSPRLEDLTTEVFERLRLHPGVARGQAGALFGIQKAVSSLGFCDPRRRRRTAPCRPSRARQRPGLT
jgi:hypothetical protein